MLSLRRLITVSGKVIDRETKAGVAGVTLQFYTMSEKRDIQLTRYAKTDAQGEYSLRVLPGQVCGYVSAARKHAPCRTPGQDFAGTR